jgi:hypothetical protein
MNEFWHGTGFRDMRARTEPAAGQATVRLRALCDSGWVVTTIYGMTMTRTTVYLSLDAKRRLSAAAHRLHRSEADLIRDAIGRLLAEEPERPRPDPPRLDLDPSIADHVDEYLSAGFGAAGLEDTPWGG